jgi:hypothetical protein
MKLLVSSFMKPRNFAGKFFYLIVRPNAVAGSTEANCPTAAGASHVSKHVLEIVFFPHFLVSVCHCDLPPALRRIFADRVLGEHRSC